MSRRLLGADYVANLLDPNIGSAEALRVAYGDTAILDALTGQILALARRVATDSGRTLEQLATDLVDAAEGIDLAFPS